VAVIFPRWTNKIPHLLGVGGPLVLITVVSAIWYYASPWYTDVGYQPVQPVEFSHKLHAGEMGLDCRYCHNAVEVSARAAVPPTATCMNCHAKVKLKSKKLALVRESAKTGKAIPWVRVHMVPDYAFFNHQVHVAAGVGCVSCHGRIDQMERVTLDQPLSMSWCLDCHRNPTPHLRPKDQITNMRYDPVASGYNAVADPARTRDLDPPKHCSGCHR
jgi:hypothetical protein